MENIDESKFEVYSSFFLSIYDYFVLSFICPLVWRCSKKKILTLYNQHVSNTHLDIGVGTGYFLNHCQYPSRHPQITLLDLNENCLRVTEKRLKRFNPTSIQANIYSALPPLGKKFDSVGLNYLLHCLPGTIYDKARVFENINPFLNSQATIFGATVLNKDLKMNFIASKLMKIYNDHGIFFNAFDSLRGLREVLEHYYRDVEITLTGCVALFVCKTNPL